jgi:hypothetical protein
VVRLLASRECLVLLRIHQPFQILDTLLIYSDLGNPAATVRVVLRNLIDSGGLLLQQEVDVGDLAADGGVDVAGALDRLDGADRVAGLDRLALLRQLDVDDVAEGLGRVLADSDDACLVVGRKVNPFVVLCVFPNRSFGYC